MKTNRSILTLLVASLLFLGLLAPLSLEAKIVKAGGGSQVLVLPRGNISQKQAQQLQEKLHQMVKSHNLNPRGASTKYNGVNRKQEMIDLSGYGVISKSKREDLGKELQRMIQQHNKAFQLEQQKLQQQQQMQMNPQQMQQQQMQQQQMQQQMMQQQQLIRQQQEQLMRQQWEAQQRMQDEQRRQQEQARQAEIDRARAAEQQRIEEQERIRRQQLEEEYRRTRKPR